MQYTDAEYYYALLMSDDVELGKGEYVRGENISQEAITYNKDDLSAKGTMGLDNDQLTLTLDYQLAEGITLSFQRDKQKESAVIEGEASLTIDLIGDSACIEKIIIPKLELSLVKDEQTLLLYKL